MQLTENVNSNCSLPNNARAVNLSGKDIKTSFFWPMIISFDISGSSFVINYYFHILEAIK